MQRFFKNISNPESYQLILSCIKDGSIIKKDLKFFYELFYLKRYSQFHRLKKEFLFLIKREQRFLDEKLFSKAFGKDFKELKEILENETLVASFPLVKEDSGRIANVFVVHVNSENIPLTFPNTSQDIILNLKKIKKLINKNFFVAFDIDNFTGNSYNLAIASTFFVDKRVLDKFVFTGNIGSNGEVLKVNDLRTKKKLAMKSKKFFICHNNLQKLEDLKQLNQPDIEIPFIQLFGKPKSELKRNFLSLKGFASFLNLTEKDCAIYTEKLIENSPQVWENFLKQAIKKLNRIYSLPFDVTINYLGSLSSFSFALGIVFGAKRKVKIYHFQDGNIFKIFDFCNNSLRRIKEKKRNIEFLEYNLKFKEFSGKPEISFSLFLASHNPHHDVENYVKKNLKTSLIEISLKNNQGNIPVDNQKLWIEIAKELFTIIDEIPGKIEKYHFFMSMPVPLAFVLGMSIGDYKKNSIYNYDKFLSDYIPVLDSEKTEFLKNFF